MYNAAATVAGTLQSLADQSLEDWEAVVVDDGSTDGGGEIVRAIAGHDSRVRLIQQENRGVSAARNTATRVCQGEYLYWLDPDDLCLPGALEALVQAAESNGLGAAVGNHDVVDTAGKCLHEYRLRPRGIGLRELVDGSSTRCGSHVVRRDLALLADGTPVLWEESLSLWEDRDYWIRLVEAGVRWGVIDRVVTNYVIRPPGGSGEQSLSKRANEMLRSGAQVLRSVFERHAGEIGFELERLREVLRLHGLHSATRAAAISGDGEGAAAALSHTVGDVDWDDQQLIDAGRFGVLYGRGVVPGESSADPIWISGLDSLWAALGNDVERRRKLWARFVRSTVTPNLLATASIDALASKEVDLKGVVVVGFGEQGRAVAQEATRRGLPVRVRDDAIFLESLPGDLPVEPMASQVSSGWGVLVSPLTPASLRGRFEGEDAIFSSDVLDRIVGDSSWDPAATALEARSRPGGVVGH